MNKFDALEVFVAVVEAGSFAAAARRMRRSRSQLNRLVIQLEDELQASLLQRTTRSLTLTPAGQAFYERSRYILQELDDAQRMLQNRYETAAGEIKINAPMSFGVIDLAPVIAGFMAQYPKIDVQLMLADRFIDPVSEGFDLTIRIQKSQAFNALIQHELTTIQLLPCASPELLKQFPAPQVPADLKNFSCLHYGNFSSGRQWKFIGPDQSVHRVTVHSRLCANNGQVTKICAVAGLGVIVSPAFILRDALANGSLVRILPDYTIEPVTLSMLYAPNRYLSTPVRLFIKFMQSYFSADELASAVPASLDSL